MKPPKKFPEKDRQILCSRKRSPPKDDDAMRKRQPPTRFGQKGKPIVVGDMVKTRYGNTIDYWLTKVLTIEGDHMMVQWASAYLLHRCGDFVADGGYADDCSALGGASCIMQPIRKGIGQRHIPRSSLGLCTTSRKSSSSRRLGPTKIPLSQRGRCSPSSAASRQAASGFVRRLRK